MATPKPKTTTPAAVVQQQPTVPAKAKPFKYLSEGNLLTDAIGLNGEPVNSIDIGVKSMVKIDWDLVKFSATTKSGTGLIGVNLLKDIFESQNEDGSTSSYRTFSGVVVQSNGLKGKAEVLTSVTIFGYIVEDYRLSLNGLDANNELILVIKAPSNREQIDVKSIKTKGALE